MTKINRLHRHRLATGRDKDGNGGYVSYEQLTDADKDKMKATLAQLSENVSQVGGTLGLK